MKRALSLETASAPFEPAIAFSRTLGLVTEKELEDLQTKTVAIAGLGGVGGSHLLTLTRLGVGRFHLADFDVFALENFNRQAGANMATIGRKKLDVMDGLARQINPALKIKAFPEGVTHRNLDEFLCGADVYVDGLDFFAFEIRSAVFKGCYDNGIPAVTAAPIGLGAALLNFMPGKMSFQEYFDWRRHDSEFTKAVKFIIGLTPSLPQRRSLVDPRFVDLKAQRGPSTPMACELCAGLAGSQVMKILLRRGRVRAVPEVLHFDAYLDKLYSSRIWFGNRNPLQKIKMAFAKRLLEKSRSG